MSIKKYIAVAVDDNFGIGKHNTLVWHFKKEMQYFKNLTTKTLDQNKKNIVMMGKNTWLSLPEKARPLSGRKNIVLSFDEIELPE
jgi:dihydrofolate reductase